MLGRAAITCRAASPRSFFLFSYLVVKRKSGTTEQENKKI
jgi:hypothetical protein